MNLLAPHHLPLRLIPRPPLRRCPRALWLMMIIIIGDDNGDNDDNDNNDDNDDDNDTEYDDDNDNHHNFKIHCIH